METVTRLTRDGRRKPPKKLRKMVKIEKEATAKRKGEILGELKAYRKQPLGDILKTLLIKQAEKVDFVEVGAMAGLTLIVHGLILETPAYKQRVLDLTPIGFLGAAGIPYTMFVYGWQEVFGTTAPALTDESSIYWVYAFVIAFMFVKFGGQIIGGIGDVTTKLATMVGMFL
jgi:hypothetical protein